MPFRGITEGIYSRRGMLVGDIVCFAVTFRSYAVAVVAMNEITGSIWP